MDMHHINQKGRDLWFDVDEEDMWSDNMSAMLFQIFVVDMSLIDLIPKCQEQVKRIWHIV